MKDLAPHWVAFLGVLAGAVVASFSSFLSNYFTFRRDRWFRKREEKLKRYEAIYEALDRFHAMHNSVITPACFELGQGRLAEVGKKIQHEDSSKLDMLVGLYAPEISEDYSKLRDRYTRTLVQLMETSLEVAQQKPAKAGIQKMMSDLHAGASEIIALKKEPARLARAHDL